MKKLVSPRRRQLRRMIAAAALLLAVTISGHAQNLTFADAQASAAKGDPEAEFQLGRAYDRGDGVPQDYAQALNWYKKAAEAGNAKAMNNLGVIYADGHGVKADRAEAINWFRQGAEKGAVRAQVNLAQHLEADPATKTSSVQWYRKAAEQGDVDSAAHMAKLAYFGDEGVKQDYSESAHWAQLAAARDNVQAETILGVLYMNGFGMARSPKDARRWLQKAADQGDAKAEGDLGSTYLDPAYGPIDRVTAYFWLCLSGQGNLMAQKLLHEMKFEMKPDEVAAGDKRIHDHELKASGG
jgi:TPR repeat protein